MIAATTAMSELIIYCRLHVLYFEDPSFMFASYFNTLTAALTIR
jgi:hypothetical protein